MSQKVEIISQEAIFKKYIFQIDEVHLKHERYDGKMSSEITRLNFNRGDSVGMLIHHVEDDTVLLIEQFRYPSYTKGHGWLIELPAGIVDDGESPQASAEREIQEEVGYIVQHIEPIRTFFVSPGGTSERIHLFYSKVKTSDKSLPGGGLTGENEDIKSLHLPVDKAIEMMQSGEIVDAKTIIALQWLQMTLNR